MIDPSLPLVDLHRHLDGNIKPHTIWQLADKHGIQLPAANIDELAVKTQIQGKTSDLLAFLEKLDMGVSVLADAEACHLVAYENMRDASQQNLDYVELRFSPYYMAQAFDLNLADVVEAVADGAEQGARDFGVQFNLIGILSRTFGAEACMAELNGLLAHKEKIRALDLAGDEIGYPAPLFVEHFTRARDANWSITVHAGEADGPQSIWNAINLLGATRIGHGVAAIKDQKLMDYMRENQIAIESCPTSNYQTATVQDLAQHPLPEFLARGLLVTLNTDDPAVSNIDIQHEYKVAADTLGLNNAQLRVIQENGLKAAFLTEQQKQTLLTKHSQ